MKLHLGQYPPGEFPWERPTTSNTVHWLTKHPVCSEEIEYYELKNSDLTIHKRVMPPSCVYQPSMLTKQYLFVDDKSILCSH